jgi:hypothetical protein
MGKFSMGSTDLARGMVMEYAFGRIDVNTLVAGSMVNGTEEESK